VSDWVLLVVALAVGNFKVLDMGKSTIVEHVVTPGKQETDLAKQETDLAKQEISRLMDVSNRFDALKAHIEADGKNVVFSRDALGGYAIEVGNPAHS
jgi:hypothetical protein